MHHKSIFVASMCVFFMLAGCAVGPDFKPPAAPKITAYTLDKANDEHSESHSNPRSESHRIHLDKDGVVAEQWWRVYQSDALNQMVETGLNESPSLQMARATLQAMQEDFTAQGGSIRYPNIDATSASRREKVSGVTFGQGGGFIYSLHTASVDVSFMLDPFGAGRRYLESVRAQVDYQGFQTEAAYLTLTTNIVNTAISEASFRGQIDVANEIISKHRDQLAIVERQFELGVVTQADVLAQRTSLAQSETQLPPLRQQLAQAQHQLSMLVGRFPNQGAMPVFVLNQLQIPKTLPFSLPSELVRQRPDIRAAEAQLHQASALIGLATANQYPSITLTAGFGRQAVKFSDLLSGPASTVWNIGGNVLLPLFHGGELSAKRRQALANFAAARAQYRQTVLQAFRDVADVLLALHNDGKTLELQQRAASLSRQTLQLVQRQFELGATSYVSLLSAQQQFQSNQLAVVQARATLLTDTAALFQAMGGGLRQRDDAYQPVARDASLMNFWKSAKQPGATDENN
ncbi:MAG: efflux transporter outer membrane subunit [Mariprofundaceae bacterium]